MPIYYYFGCRKEQVNHCRLGLAISSLNYDLLRRHLLDCDPVCSLMRIYSRNILLPCPLYDSIRNSSINKISEKEKTSIHFCLETTSYIWKLIINYYYFLRKTDRL